MLKSQKFNRKYSCVWFVFAEYEGRCKENEREERKEERKERRSAGKMLRCVSFWGTKFTKLFLKMKAKCCCSPCTLKFRDQVAQPGHLGFQVSASWHMSQNKYCNKIILLISWSPTGDSYTLQYILKEAIPPAEIILF